MAYAATPAWLRFWRKVYIGTHGSMCWTWNAYLSPGGYGQFFVKKNKPVQAHRFAYEQLVGPIPKGLQLDHLCRVRCCVNPAHLEPVTARENILRGNTVAAKRVLITHCPQGHEYTEQNTYLYRRCRQCVTCRKARMKIWNANAKERRAR